MTPPTYIAGFELVLAAYDYWPSFHDAEIISIALDRKEVLFGPVRNARVNLVVHCHEMTSEVEDGFYRLTKQNLVHFEFENVTDVSLSDFNHQNALFDLSFTEQSLDKSGNHSFAVDLNSSFGLAGSFVAAKGKVVSVRPCDKKGNSLA